MKVYKNHMMTSYEGQYLDVPGQKVMAIAELIPTSRISPSDVGALDDSHSSGLMGVLTSTPPQLRVGGMNGGPDCSPFHSTGTSATMAKKIAILTSSLAARHVFFYILTRSSNLKRPLSIVGSDLMNTIL
jgi:hypothetical protein